MSSFSTLRLMTNVERDCLAVEEMTEAQLGLCIAGLFACSQLDSIPSVKLRRSSTTVGSLSLMMDAGGKSTLWTLRQLSFGKCWTKLS